MIFITVGTHEQPFNRLVEYIDKLRKNGVIKEDVIIQTGFSTYEPKYCEWNNLYSYKQINQYVKDARIVITHGGPSSFITPLQFCKIPIVVPRQRKYEEHVNNHQVEFSKAVEERLGNIIVIENINDLAETISSYEDIVSSKQTGYESNNQKFNFEFKQLVEEIFKG